MSNEAVTVPDERVVFQPETVPMREELKEAWGFGGLLRQLLTRELKIRYKNSALGFLWSIIPPLVQVAVYTFLFRSVIGLKVPSYSAYLLGAMIPWMFFQTSILDSGQSILANLPIIRKIYLPRELIPLSYVLSNFIHFLLGWAVYLLAFCVFLRPFGRGIPLLPSMAWFPVIVLVEFMLVTGMSLWIAALNVMYEDVKFILQTLFQVLLFVLPILYPSDVAAYILQKHPWLFKLYMLNPITAVIDAFRKTMLEPVSPSYFNHNMPKNSPALPWDKANFAEAALLCLFLCWWGYHYFNKRKWQFTERP